MSKTYFIDHIREGSINLGDREKHTVTGSYQDAVDKAHEIWKSMESKTGVCVHSDSYCLHFWHRISAEGAAEDRNTNSGVKFIKCYETRYDAARGYIVA